MSTKFKKQLNLLTESLASTTSHFIRCVKPNVSKKPKVFEGPKVMDQLRCSGMIEIRNSYPWMTEFFCDQLASS